MRKNPLDAFFEKKASLGEGMGKHFGTALMAGAGTAVAGAAVTALAPAAANIFNAITKKRDFNQMMQSPFNTDLHEHLSARPKEFNLAFSSLRSVTPEITRDPMIAGQYMRRVMQSTPDTAGGIVLEALQHKEKFGPGVVSEAFGRGATEGARSGFAESMKTDESRKHLERQQQGALSLEEAKSRMGLQNQMAGEGARHENQLKLEAFKKHLGGLGKINPTYEEEVLQGDLERAPKNPAFR